MVSSCATACKSKRVSSVFNTRCCGGKPQTPLVNLNKTTGFADLHVPLQSSDAHDSKHTSPQLTTNVLIQESYSPTRLPPFALPRLPPKGYMRLLCALLRVTQVLVTFSRILTLMLRSSEPMWALTTCVRVLSLLWLVRMSREQQLWSKLQPQLRLRQHPTWNNLKHTWRRWRANLHHVPN